MIENNRNTFYQGTDIGVEEKDFKWWKRQSQKLHNSWFFEWGRLSMTSLMKFLYSCITIVFISITVVVIVVILGIHSIFYKKTQWTEMKPPSELYDVSESNEITMFLYLDDGSFYNYDNLLSNSEKVAYIVRWIKVPSSITRKTGLTSIDGYKTYKLEKNGGITFTFDKYYDGAEITVKAEGVRGKDYYPH